MSTPLLFENSFIMNINNKSLYNEWLALYRDNFTPYKIGKKYNLSSASVKFGLKKMGIIFPTPQPIKSPTDRFNNFVIKQEGCWGWSGALDTAGYGMISIGGKLHKASRYSYRIYKGDPSGSNVLHKCDNPICTNPDHLFLGSQSDNSRDMYGKGRWGNSNLNTERVKEIKRLILAGEKNGTIAKKYKVKTKVIRAIKIGERWRYVTI